MSSVIASLTILAVLGASLALAGSGGGGSVELAGGNRLKPGVAIRVSAPAPARTLPAVAMRQGDSSLSAHPAFARGMRRTWVAVTRRGVDPRRELLAPLSFLEISLERSCPPPAVLRCRPAVRVTGRLRGQPPPALRGDLRTALATGLHTAGSRGLTLHGSPGDDFSGRVTSRGETLARWRLVGDLLEVATGGLRLGGEGRASEARASGDRGPLGIPRLRIETNPAALAALLR